MRIKGWNRLINFAVLFSFVMAYGGGAGVSEVYAANNKAELLADYVAAVQGTAKYHNVAKALDDGYVETSCVDGRGVAYRKADLVDNPEIDPAKPEFLLYDLQVTHGQENLKLRGVAYLTFDPDPPPIFGENLIGPVGTGFFFTHVWVWLEGPHSDLLVSLTHPMVGCE